MRYLPVVLLGILPVSALCAKDKWDSLRKLKAGETIQVMQTDGTNHEGKLRELTAESITLALPAGEFVIHKEEVAVVARWPHLKKINRDIGGVIGVIAGIGLIAASGADAGTCSRRSGEITWATGDLGAWIGEKVSPTWVVYRAPKAKVRR